MGKIEKNYQKIIVLCFFIFLLGLIILPQCNNLKLYYIEIQKHRTVESIKCSENSPIWMKETLIWSIKRNQIFTNQIAYLDEKKMINFCQSGLKYFELFGKINHSEINFRYASLTKVITHHAILDLIKQKKIKLDDKLFHFFPELNIDNFQDKRILEITLQQLLEHRSGFDTKISADPFLTPNVSIWCPYKINDLERITLDYNPNKYYSYDNRNTCLLSMVLSKITNKEFTQYISHRYSLKSHNIFFNNNDDKKEVDYSYGNSIYWNKKKLDELDYYALSAMGGLSGNAINFVKLLNEKVLNKDFNVFQISDIAQKECMFNNFKSCNGIIFRVFQPDSKSRKIYFRNGSLGPASSLLAVTEDRRLAVWVGNGVRLDAELNELDYLLYKNMQIFN